MTESVKYVGVHKDPSEIGDLYEVVVERTGQEPYHLDPRTDLSFKPGPFVGGFGDDCEEKRGR
jgi:hypothetical protein